MTTVAALSLALPGCSDTMAEISANQTTKILQKAIRSFDGESDPWLAREAAIGNLKFAEGVLEASPDNGDLMVLIARNYARFAYDFLADDLEKVAFGSADYTTLQRRAIDFNRRARAYAVRRMQQDFEDFGSAVFASGDRFEQILGLCERDDHLAALYYLAFAWGNIVRLAPDDPEALADVPRIKAIMGWVREKDPDFESGGPNLYFAEASLALSKEQGGDPEAAKAAFEAAIASSGGRFLLTKALYARDYMRAVGNKEGYQRLLQEVLDAADDLMPEQQLANTLAKHRAKRWLAEAGKLFD
jgi:hypothetical protein